MERKVLYGGVGGLVVYREGEGWGIRMKRLFLEIFEGVILCLVMCISIVIRNPKIKHSLLLIYLGPVV
jgi:hypothetical protein